MLCANSTQLVIGSSSLACKASSTQGLF